MEFKNTADVTKYYRAQQNISLAKFSDALNEKLIHTSVTRAAVSSWENEVYGPRAEFLLIVMMVYSDWRMEWAIDCLCAALPEVFERDEHGALRTLKSAYIHG